MKKKKVIRKVILMIALLAEVLLSKGVYAGGFSDFFDQTWNSIKSSYDGTPQATYTVDAQKRRYYIGGNMRYTVPNDTIQPLTMTPPKISAGCGGISVSLGSLSYLGFDELVNKIQTALRAAPALAVQLVISNLCEKCNSIISYLEQVSDVVNSLNMDSCALAKTGVGAMYKYTGRLMKDMVYKGDANDSNEAKKEIIEDKNTFSAKLKDFMKDISGGFGLANSYDCAVIADKEKRSQCLQALIGTVAVFPRGYYEAVAGILKFSDMQKDAVNVLRAYTGDFVSDPSENTDIFVPPKCRKEGDGDLSTSLSLLFDYGNVTVWKGELVISGGTVDMNCTGINLTNYIDSRKNNLNNIYTKMLNGTSLSNDDIKLLNTIPVPIYVYFRDLARLYYISPEATTVLKDEIIDDVSRYVVMKVFLVALNKVTSYTLSSSSALASKLESAGASKENYKEFKSKLKEIDQEVKRLIRDNEEEGRESFAEFEKKVKEAETKVNAYLAKYYLKASYEFGN